MAGTVMALPAGIAAAAAAAVKAAAAIVAVAVAVAVRAIANAVAVAAVADVAEAVAVAAVAMAVAAVAGFAEGVVMAAVQRTGTTGSLRLLCDQHVGKVLCHAVAVRLARQQAFQRLRADARFATQLRAAL